ncbi:RDD family protein [Streptomyces sp. NPDC050610]|uniref:RDD family protein n=1 Tax=Streptomyces sp. NPDC050610 TaxID=3157097 RepID=UPI0034406778
MSSDQARPPEDDPFRKKPQEPPPSAPPPPPYDADAPAGGGGGPYGDGGGGPYGGNGPYGGAGPGNPYGDQFGAGNPLAGMPPLAGRGRRLVARIIDGLIVGIPVSVIVSLAVGGYNPTKDTVKSTSMSVIIAIVYFVYEGLMLTSRGQTVGKRMMKIRVAMLENGAIPAGRPGWARAATYSLPEIVPCCGFIFWLVNVLWCTWDKPYQQCLHDKAARTVVVTAG